MTMMRSKLIFIAFCVLIMCFFSCSGDKQPEKLPELRIMTHDSFSISKAVLEQFEKTIHAKILILKSGDAGQALNKAILSAGNPLADIFYGVDNTFLSRATKSGIFVPYAPAGLDTVSSEFRLDPENRLVPVDFGDVCLNYDIRWFKEHDKKVPSMLEDLVKPEYKGLLVVENPATSSPGLAFMLATISRFSTQGYIDYWKKLKANDVLVTNGWNQAYWGKFTAASKGDRPIVVSYASSPAAEVFFSKTKLESAPTGAVTANGSAFRQIEFVGILKGASDKALAEKAMDFILSKKFQEDIPLQMFVFPVNKKASLPEVFVKYAAKAEKPAVVPPESIDTGRDKWIREWTQALLN